MTKVKLRKRAMTNDRHSLYLDFYPPIPTGDGGKPTRREFLKLYVYDKPRNPFEKEHNKETVSLAEAIRAQRQVSIQNGNYGFISTSKEKEDFVEYFKVLAEARTGSNHDNWNSALNYLEQFTGGKAMFKDVTVKFCNDFKHHLLTSSSTTKRKKDKPLSQNSAAAYFNKFKSALKQAYKDGYLQTDINARVSSIKQAETNRQHLSLEELNRLAATECELPELRIAALFSALSSLRFSDIIKLRWSEIRHSQESGYAIHYRQQKTKSMEVLPVSEQAVQLLGEPGGPEDRVFKTLEYSAWMNSILSEWVKRAGVERKITFHSFRHTFATLQIESGTDLYTISKMMGHKAIKTTQVYVKIVDKMKQQAANRIKLDF